MLYWSECTLCFVLVECSISLLAIKLVMHTFCASDCSGRRVKHLTTVDVEACLLRHLFSANRINSRSVEQRLGSTSVSYLDADIDLILFGPSYLLVTCSRTLLEVAVHIQWRL